MLKHKPFRRLASFFALVLVMTSPATTVLAADSKTQDSTQSVTQTYGTSSVVQKGMIVRLDPKDSTKVAALKADESKEMHGVVVAANDAALTLTGDSSKRQVFIATYGRYPVLVSNQNGAIKEGDLITISALDGVGMKTGDSQEVVLGKAVTAFDGTTNVESTATLKDNSGKKLDVSIGRIKVDIGISHNPLQSNGPVWGIATFLQSISNGVAGKEVQPVRVYISLLILMLTTAIGGFVLIGGVRSAIVSIGRNPLAKVSIMRGLFQVVLSSVIIFVLGVFGVYLLLKL
ncbi:hypothetical protein KDA23_00260 [Candidatus Saccharibacteria bacterium]|nr:hypothetical protein [Candidatus Saccharibacteria bacterium]